MGLRTHSTAHTKPTRHGVIERKPFGLIGIVLLDVLVGNCAMHGKSTGREEMLYRITLPTYCINKPNSIARQSAYMRVRVPWNTASGISFWDVLRATNWYTFIYDYEENV